MAAPKITNISALATRDASEVITTLNKFARDLRMEYEDYTYVFGNVFKKSKTFNGTKAYTYTELIRSSCLGFRKCNPVSCEFEVVNGCERVIYFIDGVNKDKAINLDRLTDYTDQPIVNTNANDLWKCGLFLLAQEQKIPNAQLDVRYTSGNLELGMYQIAWEPWEYGTYF